MSKRTKPQKTQPLVASRKPTCWVITDGNAGTFTQAMGLAEAMSDLIKSTKPLNVQHKIFRATIPFTAVPLPFFLWLARLAAKFCLTKDSHKLEPECTESTKLWPDIVIGCGRRTIPSLLYIKKASRGETFCVYVLDPRIPAKHFDLVIKMPHDPITGSNVITTPLSLNRINKTKLAEEAKKFQHIFKKFPAPYYTVLIGGDTKNYKMSEAACLDLINQVKAIAADCRGSVLITPSRRTPKPVLEALSKLAKQNSKIFLHDLVQPNPYFAMLALASCIFVTNDSVNMISEACACCRNVCLLPLVGLTKGRTVEFGKSVVAAGLASTFDATKPALPFISVQKTPIALNTNNKKIAEAVVKSWRQFVG